MEIDDTHTTQATHSTEKKLSKFEVFELWSNTLNHSLILLTTLYVTWYIFHEGFNQYQHYHTFFAVYGYQLFMSEGILAMYNKNNFTMFIVKRRLKIWVHLVLQVIGSVLALFAIPYQYYKREQLGRSHLNNYHAIFGESHELYISIIFKSF
jgi:hypothetical protein